MTRQDQQQIRREVQDWCPVHYGGEVRQFFDAQCKLPNGHAPEGVHRTWRFFGPTKQEILYLQWSSPNAH